MTSVLVRLIKFILKTRKKSLLHLYTSSWAYLLVVSLSLSLLSLLSLSHSLSSLSLTHTLSLSLPLFHSLSLSCSFSYIFSLHHGYLYFGYNSEHLYFVLPSSLYNIQSSQTSSSHTLPVRWSSTNTILVFND